MIISEDIVADKLKGHTYNLSTYEYMEVISHIDPEMHYIVTDAINCIILDATASYNLFALFRRVAGTVYNVIAERRKFTGTCNVERIANKMFTAYKNLNTRNVGIYELSYMLLIYAVNDSLIQIRFLE